MALAETQNVVIPVEQSIPTDVEPAPEPQPQPQGGGKVGMGAIVLSVAIIGLVLFNLKKLG